MFNGQIVEKLMESVINSRKESTFRYLNSSIGLEKLAENFLLSDESRLTTVNCNEVFNFLVSEFKALGFYYSKEGIFVHQNLFNSVQSVTDNLMNNSNNGEFNLLMLGADDANLKILDLLSALGAKESIPDIILNSVINDIGFILATINENNANTKDTYENYTLNLLRFSQSAEPFKNVLSFNCKISGVFELISNLPQKNNIMFDLVNDVNTIANIPNQSLVDFMIKVPSHTFNNLNNDVFLKLLEIMPIPTIISYGNSVSSGNQETLFSKYTLKIKSMIDSGDISSKFLDTLKEQANTKSIEGQLLLQLLGEAISKFLSNNSLLTQTQTQTTTDLPPVYQASNNISSQPIIVEPHQVETLNVYEPIQVTNEVINSDSQELQFVENTQENTNELALVVDNNTFNTNINSPIENNDNAFSVFSNPQINTIPQNNFANTNECEQPVPGPFHTFC